MVDPGFSKGDYHVQPFLKVKNLEFYYSCYESFGWKKEGEWVYILH
jgi:hypothetical protein